MGGHDLQALLILPSARKRGISDQRIRWALEHARAIESHRHDDPRRDWEMWLGPDGHGFALEVGVRWFRDGSGEVFHAMKMRSRYNRQYQDGSSL